MTTLFISDLHLDDARPRSTSLFEQFIRSEACRSEALYILGDLFEYWLGDDVRTDTSNRVAAALSPLEGSEIPCYFMHGNRDFLLGEDYAAHAGLQLLPEAVVVDLYGAPTLLLHGDTLCTDDLSYQAVRRQVRDPRWQEEFLSRSIADRMAFANDAREQSQEHKMTVSMEITDVNPASVTEAFDTHGVHEMIHGHTHRPAVHDHALKDGPARRIVLGDWYERGSVLRVSPEGARLDVI